MIVPMKKYSFLVYHRDYIDFLKGIQQLGVLHVIEKQSGVFDDEELTMNYQKLSELNTAIKFLSKYHDVQTEESVKDDGTAALSLLKNLWTDQNTNEQKLAQINKEILQLEPWGNFDRKNIQLLAEAGLKISFFSCSSTKYNPEWDDLYAVARINEIANTLFFVIFSKQDELIEIDADKIKLPDNSLQNLKEDRGEIEKLQEKIAKSYHDIAAEYQVTFENMRQRLISELNFKKVILNTSKEAEEKLMLLEGWIPKDSEKKLLQHLEKQGVYYLSENPSPHDNVPVKLKNNWFAKLFEPIGELYSLPNYYEADLTPLFAPFFMLFFGFCLGDAGYGIFILVLVTILKLKMKNSKFRGIFTLAQWLGFSTIIMGFVSGTFFGINLLNIEGFSLRKYMLDNDRLFYLAIIVGLVQILFGLCIKAYGLAVRKGFKYALSTLGWILLFISGIIIFVLKKYNIMPAGLQPFIMYPVFGISGILIFIFNDPDANPLISSLKGIWDAYGMLSGVFGDTLSYIRLFALGISSAILGLVVNTIGMQILGISYIGPVLFVIFLLFGHGLTISLAVLGAFVHPMRLTFVEFYKNAGFTGGGKAYNPFKIEVNN
jgi:V/A-type H+-transporting ATPase subunit I